MDDTGQNPLAINHDSSGGIVTGCIYSKDFHTISVEPVFGKQSPADACNGKAFL
jgi:hypothetical protein